MARRFVYLKKFSAKWDALNLTDDDLIPLEKFLDENPQAGEVVQGTGGIRKVRWALSDTGKSGGIRVAYLDIVVCERIYMLDLFPKSEKDNYTAAEKKILKKLVTDLKSEMKKGGD
ncbi:MAG: type II toxin-antitoxin system RelE/ParE family toxin [Oscillospiraceae bacterium]|nr:type II toxin-antitoxin system RelE/ParE family toxin [Oscillospiraceae bacterium]